MAKAGLINNPEDYKKPGVDPDRIEAWEDSIRITPDRMNWELICEFMYPGSSFKGHM